MERTQDELIALETAGWAALSATRWKLAFHQQTPR